MALSLATLGTVATLLVGVAFLVAGVLKLRDSRGFRRAIDAYGFLPQRIRPPVARILPILEIALGLATASGLAPVAMAALALAFLSAFTGAAYLAFHQGKQVDCGCFGGVLEASTLHALLLRNGALAALAAIPLVDNTPARSLPQALLSLLIVGSCALLAVMLTAKKEEAEPQGEAATTGSTLGRRELLGRTLQLVAGASAATVLGGMLGLRSAEAACAACKTCAPDVVFISCAGGCCAAYWVRDLKYCSGPCYSCSSWRIETYCGEYDCC